MLRASVAGAFDFSQFDPRNSRHRLRLSAVLTELGHAARRSANELEYNFFLELLRLPTLEQDKRRLVSEAMFAHRQLALRGYCPWDALYAAEVQPANHSDLQEQYHQTFGRPGEARYDNMVTELANYFEMRKSNPEALKRIALKRKAEEAQQQRRNAHATKPVQ